VWCCSKRYNSGSIFSNHVGSRPALTEFATHWWILFACTHLELDSTNRPLNRKVPATSSKFPELQEASSNYVGVIVKQYMATIFFRQGRRFKHGSSIDPWGDKNISKTEIRSVGMVIGQKPLLLSLSQKHKHETDWYDQLERFHIFVRSRKNVECEKKNRT